MLVVFLLRTVVYFDRGKMMTDASEFAIFIPSKKEALRTALYEFDNALQLLSGFASYWP